MWKCVFHFTKRQAGRQQWRVLGAKMTSVAIALKRHEGDVVFIAAGSGLKYKTGGTKKNLTESEHIYMMQSINLCIKFSKHIRVLQLKIPKGQ